MPTGCSAPSPACGSPSSARQLEPGFYPGASGRVGYEVYLGKNEPDAYSLHLRQHGPRDRGDGRQRARTTAFPRISSISAGSTATRRCCSCAADSPFQTVDDVIAAGKERTLSVGTSRLPHPASIGALLLAEHTGAQFNLVPLSGGRNTIAGVVTGEMDFGVLPSGAVAARRATRCARWRSGTTRTRCPASSTMRRRSTTHFGTSFPSLVSARAFGIHTKAIEEHPDRFEMLQRHRQSRAEDPGLAGGRKGGGPAARDPELRRTSRPAPTTSRA